MPSAPASDAFICVFKLLTTAWRIITAVPTPIAMIAIPPQHDKLADNPFDPQTQQEREADNDTADGPFGRPALGILAYLILAGQPGAQIACHEGIDIG
jgi:hypothetical protein